jgi:hypothetical protein
LALEAWMYTCGTCPSCVLPSARAAV